MATKFLQREGQSLQGWCDRVLKTSVWALLFLVPVFFAPWTYDVGEFNKQAILFLLSFVALVAWMLKSLIAGSVTVRLSKIHIAMGALLGAFVLSTIFSISSYTSFWGVGQFASQSLICVLSLTIMYFLVSNAFSDEDIITSFFTLAISSTLVFLFGILQLLAIHIVPFDFANNNSFNTIGSLGSLGFFAATLLPLFIIFAIKVPALPSSRIFEKIALKKWWRILCATNIALVFIVLLIINYNFLWLICAAGMFFLIVFWALRRDIFDARWMFLPVFFLVVSLFFLALSPQLKFFRQDNVEVSLNTPANVQINLQSLKSLLVLGSGPGTFSYDFLKYKAKDFNSNTLWNVNFNSGSSKAMTAFAELGIIGFLVLLAAMALPMFYGARRFMADRDAASSDPGNLYIIAGFLAAFIAQTVGYFLYNANISLDLVWFFAIAAVVVLLAKNSRTYALKSSSLLTLGMIFLFVVLVIFHLAILVVGAQRYMADITYRNSLILFSQGKKAESLVMLKSAAESTGSNLYFNQLSLFSLLALQGELTSPSNPDTAAEKKIIQGLIDTSIGAANSSISLNPRSYDNWINKAYLCQNLIGLLNEAPECTLQSYNRAMELNPYNPYPLLQQGNAYMSQAVSLPADQTSQKNSLVQKAKEKFQMAIDLKKDYASAYFQLATLLRSTGSDADAQAALAQAAKYADNDNDSSLLYQIGLTYYQNKNWSLAKDSFQKALDAVPNYANALYYLGLTYDQQGQKDQAIVQFTKLLDLNVKKSDIQKIIDNLKAGRAALEGSKAQTPNPETNPAQTPPTTKK